MDARGHCVLKGAEWTTLTGQPLDQAEGLNWLERVYPPDRALVQQTFEEALAGAFEFSLRFRVLQPDERPCWVVTGYIPAIGPPGTPFLGYLGSLTRLAASTTDTMTAYGNIGRYVPPPAHDTTQPTDALDRLADHLILAHTIIEGGGAKAALPGVRWALYEVGRALSARSRRRPTIN